MPTVYFLCITGDHERCAADVADTLGIDKAFRVCGQVPSWKMRVDYGDIDADIELGAMKLEGDWKDAFELLKTTWVPEKGQRDARDVFWRSGDKFTPEVQYDCDNDTVYIFNEAMEEWLKDQTRMLQLRRQEAVAERIMDARDAKKPETPPEHVAVQVPDAWFWLRTKEHWWAIAESEDSDDAFVIYHVDAESGKMLDQKAYNPPFQSHANREKAGFQRHFFRGADDNTVIACLHPSYILELQVYSGTCSLLYGGPLFQYNRACLSDDGVSMYILLGSQVIVEFDMDKLRLRQAWVFDWQCEQPTAFCCGESKDTWQLQTPDGTAYHVSPKRLQKKRGAAGLVQAAGVIQRKRIKQE